MKKIITHPATITIFILLVIAVVVIGYNYWDWFGGSKSTWDEKCRASGGVVKTSGEVCDYINCDRTKYSCSMNSNSPNGSITGTRSSNPSISNIFGNRQDATINDNNNSSRVQKVKNHCWTQHWTDTTNRHYDFEIWAQDCNSAYVNSASSLIMIALNYGKLNNQTILEMPLNDIVNELITELNYIYRNEIWADLILFKIAGNEVWGTGQIPVKPKTPVPPKTPTQGQALPIPIGWDSCAHDSYIDGISKIKLSWDLYSQGGICEANHIQNGMQLVKNNVQSQAGKWDKTKLLQQMTDWASAIHQTYPDVILGMRWDAL